MTAPSVRSGKAIRVLRTTRSRGFNLENYNWQRQVSVQQQLRANMALTVGYFRTWYGGFLGAGQ